jgi:chromosome segregation ATPase
MRKLGAGVHLGVDLVKFDAEIEPAVLYAMGNALVADEPATAKRIGFEKRYKITDTHGTLIAVNGSMTGGNTRRALTSWTVPQTCAAERQRTTMHVSLLSIRSALAATTATPL